MTNARVEDRKVMAIELGRVGMGCPDCGSSTAAPVVDSRCYRSYVRRRRECTDCGYRYSTREIILPDTVGTRDLQLALAIGALPAREKAAIHILVGLPEDEDYG